MADFGLSKQLYEKFCFREYRRDEVKMAFKWMAIESLQDGVFSEKTDVVSAVLAINCRWYFTVIFITIMSFAIFYKWSFGVTCWEVFTGGKIPYPGANPLHLTRILASGERMEMPDNSACSEEMLVCFIAF